MAAKGYKETEIGVIPVEWDVVKLGDIGKVSMCKRIMKSETTENGEIPFYKIGTFGKEADSYISRELYETYKNKYSFPKNGDILISASGTIGRTVIYDNKPAYFQDSNIVWIDNQEDKLLNNFLFYVYKTVKWNTDNNTIARLYNENLRSMKIPLPPLKEQKQIADILSTADEKIDAISRQIEKVETLKKGLLQKLLSEGIGHSEFKDSELGKIPESWEVVKIGKICNLTAGGTPSTSETSYWQPEEISWLSSGEVNKKKVFYTDKKISIKGLNNSSAKLLPSNSILIALAGQGKTRGTVAITEIELTTNQSVAAILPSAKVIPYYLYYNLDSRYDELRSLSTGSGGRGGLNLAILKSVNLQLPSLEEQKIIADILSTTDENLEVLRAKKEKYETLKKGLMQKLLTGEMRV